MTETTQALRYFYNKPVSSPEILVQNKTMFTEDYPLVGAMEKKVFGKTSVQEDIYSRLNKLETAVSGSVSQKSLSDRVEDLNKIILGIKNYRSDSSDDEENYSYSNEDSLRNLLDELERQLINSNFSGDSTQTRVSRLENYIFNQSSDDFPMQERIDRLASVIKSRPSSEVYKEMTELGKYQNISQGLSILAIIIMIIAGIIL